MSSCETVSAWTACDDQGYTALHLAARDGFCAEIRQLLDAGCPVDIATSKGVTPLMLACSDLRLKAVELLLNEGADPHALWCDFFDCNPLLIALHCGSDFFHIDAVLTRRAKSAPRICRVLLRHGARLDVADSRGTTPLHIDALLRDPGLVRLAIMQGVDPRALTAHRETALHVAARGAPAETVRILLDHGAEPDKADENGWTPLMEAASRGLVATVKLLIQHGADLNAADSCGSTALAIGERSGHSDCARLLSQAGGTRCEQALRHTDTPENLTHTHDAMLPDETPLTHAIWRHDFGKLRRLLAAGHDPDERDGEGNTPLHCAAELQDPKAIMFFAALIDAGADVNARSQQGQTALHALARSSSPVRKRLQNMLLKAGADPDVRDGHSQMTPLLMAVSGSHDLGFARWIVASGANPNIGDRYGYTPLHCAVTDHLKDFARLLVRHGADIHIPDGRGWSPLQRAEAEGQAEMVEIMRKGYGAA